MTRFQIITEKPKTAHGPVYLLRDAQTGALARIIPSLGANCMELRLPPANLGDAANATDGPPPIPLIDDMRHASKLADQPSRYGIPILFPWPSGIPGGEFQFEGKIHHLNDPGSDKSVYHGFANKAPWRVIRSDCDNTAAWLTCAVNSEEIDPKNSGDMARRYPSKCELEVTWRLTPASLQIIMTAKNTGTENMPLGIGIHPYFTIPFGDNGTRQTCRLVAEVGRQWDLDAIMDVKPGVSKPASVFRKKPTFNAAAAEGTPLADVDFNHVFETRQWQGHPAPEQPTPIQKSTASVLDPHNKLKLNVTASKDFGTWVFYTPPDRSAISLEPWTLAPNGFNLSAAGVKEAGMITLKPKDQWTGQVEISCESLPGSAGGPPARAPRARQSSQAEKTNPKGSQE